MRKFIYLIIICLSFHFEGKSTTYYFNASSGADITNVNSWWTATNYTGTHPGGFTASVMLINN